MAVEVADDALRRQLADATRRAETLRRVIEDISGELALEPLLTRIVASAVDLIGAMYGSIGLVIERPDASIVRIAAVHNMPPDELGAEMASGIGLAGAVLREQRPIVGDRYGELERPTLPELAEHAVVGVPIMWGGRMVGFFGIGTEPPRRFNDDDVATLALFARHAAIAIENAQRYAAERRRTERFGLIARIGRIATRDLELDDALRSAGAAIHELLGYPHVAIALADADDPGFLGVRTVGGLGAGGHSVVRVPIDSGIVGAAARERRAQLVNDVGSDTRYVVTPGTQGIRAELAVPIMHGEQLLGVLNIESGEPFRADDAASLQIIADQLAVAIVNARLFEAERRRTVRITIINRIGRLISSSLSLAEVFTRAVDAICGELNYSYVAAGLVDPDDPELLILHAQAGGARVPAGYRQSIHDGIVGAAARERQPILVNDVARDPRYLMLPQVPGSFAELAVPIVSGERLLGVLNIESEQRITPKDVDGVAIIADQLGAAVENARRFEEETERNEGLSLIARVGQRIAARLDPPELFATTVEELHGRLSYDHASVFLLDQHDPRWLVKRATASRWPGNPPGHRQSIETGLLGEAARSRQMAFSNNVADDRRYVPVPGADDLRAEIATPIVLGDRLIGVLDLASRHALNERDATAVRIVADQLAVAVDNARLFGDTQQALGEARLLYETARRFNNAAEVQDVVATYLEQVATRGRYVCTVTRYEHDAEGRRSGVEVLGRWTPERGLDLRGGRLPYAHDALDEPLDAGQTVAISDVHADRRVSPELRRIQRRSRRPALAMIPLMARGKRIGLVVLSSIEVRDWTEDDLRLYETTASQLATMIENRRQQALLFERGQELAVLEERRRLARDLHDSVTQLLFSMTLIAQSIAPAWQRDHAEGQHRVNRLLELSTSALAEMRALLAELQPPSNGADGSEPAPGDSELARLRRDGLVAAIKRHAAGVERDGLRISFDFDSYVAQPAATEEALFRITQEALNNVVKHACAKHVELHLAADERMRLGIKDDGIGYRAGAAGTVAPGVGGFGLRSMRERAEALGGSLVIEGGTRRGTTVVVEVPRLDGGTDGPQHSSADRRRPYDRSRGTTNAARRGAGRFGGRAGNQRRGGGGTGTEHPTGRDSDGSGHAGA